jgi:hypothetical protein
MILMLFIVFVGLGIFDQVFAFSSTEKTTVKLVKPLDAAGLSKRSRRSFLEIAGFGGFIGVSTSLVFLAENERDTLRAAPQLDVMSSKGLESVDDVDVDAGSGWALPSQNELGQSQRDLALKRRRSSPPSLEEAVAAAVLLEKASVALIEIDRWLVPQQQQQRSLGTRRFSSSASRSKNKNSPVVLEQALVRTHLDRYPCLFSLGDAATTLALAPDLPASFRREVGWGWGLCGWRHNCGALADAEKAFSTLQAQAGMLTVEECRFLVDVMRRSVDEVLGLISTASLGQSPLLLTLAQHPDERKRSNSRDSRRLRRQSSSSLTFQQQQRQERPPYLSTSELSKVLPGSARSDGYFGGGGAGYGSVPPSVIASGRNLRSSSSGRVVGVGGRAQGRARDDKAADDDPEEEEDDGDVAAMDAYEAEVLQSFNAQRRQRDRQRDQAGGKTTRGDQEQVLGGGGGGGASWDQEQPQQPLSKAQRDLSLRLRLGV